MAEKKVPVLLPTNVVPEAYKLDVDIDLEKFTFVGHVDIDLQINDANPSITLHSLDLTYSNEGVHLAVGDAKTIAVTDHVVNRDEETVTFTFASALPAGERATLHVDYNGDINDKMVGLYRSQYKNLQGEKKYCACTQMEPTDARRALPCYDEPARKATFEVSVKHPAHMVALSNMPSTGVEDVGNGRLRTTYEKTPKMSSYLLALVVGEFDSVEGETAAGVKVRVFTEKGKQEQGKFALMVACKTLDFYTEYFDIGYPLPKSDMVAISDFSAGAMENWGLITYRETALLIDEANSPLANRQRVAYVVAHELAHQWFGNLVTMEWWGDLWLNEGFATWVGNLAVNHLFPEWDIWISFAASTVAHAMGLDALESSHPIEVDVARSAEVNEIFDAISYHKGASLIRMLVAHVGEDNFRNGMRAYLKKHKYGNAATKDLWEAQSEASGLDIHKFMYKWTRMTGYPYVRVSLENNSLKANQKRFLRSGENREEDLSWAIPLHVTTSSGTQKFLLSEFEGSFALENLEKDSYVLVNPDYLGFYRTLYSAPLLERLGQAIKAGSTISTLDRLGLANDMVALARAGHVSTVDALQMFREVFSAEREQPVWDIILGALQGIRTVFGTEANEVAMNNYIRDLLRPVFGHLGWEAQDGEPALASLLRSSVINSLGKAGDEEVVAGCSSRIEVSAQTPVSPDLKNAVYQTFVSNGGAPAFERMLEMYRNAPMHEEAVRCLSALGSTRDSDCIAKLLAMTFTDEIRTNDVYIVYMKLGARNTTRPVAWQFFQDNYSKIMEVFGEGQFLLARMVSVTTKGFSDSSRADEVQAFFEKNPIEQAARNVKQSVEAIRGNAAWKAREENSVNDFFSNLK